MTPLLEVSEVTLRRDGTEILRSVSWQVHRGQHWLIFGPNGCGKTTLLKVLMGWEWSTTGRVSVLGQEYGRGAHLPSIRAQIGWVSSAVSERMKPDTLARETVVAGIEGMLRSPYESSEEDHARAAQALARANATRLSEKRWGILSQGERQRVLVARALVMKPAMIILDEACAGLDPVTREDFLSDLGEMTAMPDAPSLLFVTHHVEEIREWHSHALLMAGGKVISAGSMLEAFTTANLEQTFGRNVSLARNGDRYSMTIM